MSKELDVIEEALHFGKERVASLRSGCRCHSCTAELERFDAALAALAALRQQEPPAIPPKRPRCKGMCGDIECEEAEAAYQAAVPVEPVGCECRKLIAEVVHAYRAFPDEWPVDPAKPEERNSHLRTVMVTFGYLLKPLRSLRAALATPCPKASPCQGCDSLRERVAAQEGLLREEIAAFAYREVLNCVLRGGHDARSAIGDFALDVAEILKDRIQHFQSRAATQGTAHAPDGAGASETKEIA